MQLYTLCFDYMWMIFGRWTEVFCRQNKTHDFPIIQPNGGSWVPTYQMHHWAVWWESECFVYKNELQWVHTTACRICPRGGLYIGTSRWISRKKQTDRVLASPGWCNQPGLNIRSTRIVCFFLLTQRLTRLKTNTPLIQRLRDASKKHTIHVLLKSRLV